MRIASRLVMIWHIPCHRVSQMLKKQHNVLLEDLLFVDATDIEEKINKCCERKLQMHIVVGCMGIEPNTLPSQHDTSITFRPYFGAAPQNRTAM